MTSTIFSQPRLLALSAAVLLGLATQVAAADASHRKAPALAPVVVPEAQLTDAELNLAQIVQVGALACELGQTVRLDADPQSPGYFRLQLQKSVFRMRPVESRTGALRLEDRQQGVIWIQLANKSMLMSEKLGRRLADECASGEQRKVAQAMALNPQPSLLDAR